MWNLPNTDIACKKKSRDRNVKFVEKVAMRRNVKLMRREKLEISTLLEYNIFTRWENSSARECNGRKRERDGKEDSMKRRWGSLSPIYRTSAPLGTDRQLWLSPCSNSPVVLRISRCFCSTSRCSCSVAPSPFSSSRRARWFFCVLLRPFLPQVFSPRLLPSSFSVSGLDINVALISCPCFHRLRVLLFSFRFSSPSPSRFASLRLFPPPPLLALPLSPLPCFPRPYILRPVVAFFWSLFPGIELVFLPARRQVRGWLENGENGRMGTRMRMRGWGGGALSLERSRRYVR